ncbi:MAG: uracil-DNA glycosylase [Dehalococcoidia bacterium]|nr:uracil-DNA glycosylase [Dehalococcoidia bacterium]
MAAHPLQALQDQITLCRQCPRLVAYREQVGIVKRRSYETWDYWSRPVPSFGDTNAKVLAIGLAPASHGGNRTGRIFTGDASARFLMQGLHQVGLSSQPTSEHRNDGLKLQGLYLTAALRCAPPADKPTREELANCAPYMAQELALLQSVRVVLALGRTAFESYLRLVSQQVEKPVRLAFHHGARYEMPAGPPVLFASYHPSPRNHNTGRLTEASFVAVLRQVKHDAGLE